MHFPWIQRCCTALKIIPSRSITSQLRPQWHNSPISSQIPSISTSRAFTSTPTLLKRQKGGPKRDTRILLIRYFLHAPRTPRPLRLSRMRALRHWTIHRAYQLHKETLRKEQELELERMYYEMRKACEQLRTIGRDGLEGVEEEGKLFRVAMEKKGVWGGVPIEYARAQTEWPSREGWNSGWTWD